MSELSASQCGCHSEPMKRGCGCGCNSWIWIILLLVFCGGCGDRDDCGSGFSLFGGGDDDCCEWIIILLILFCCCGGHSRY